MLRSLSEKEREVDVAIDQSLGFARTNMEHPFNFLPTHAIINREIEVR